MGGCGLRPPGRRISMKLFIGIDLGTSALKLLLMDETGSIRSTVTKEYPL